jgi:cephalosporin hydroxylase
MSPLSPLAIWNIYRENPAQDMYEFSPFLRYRARGQVLEIGVRGGVSTSAFLLGLEENGGHLYSIDIKPQCGQLFDHPQWTFVAGDSTDPAIAGLVPGELDILFVDGDHSYQGVRSDLERFAPRVKRGGLILVHDIVPAAPETVTDPCFPGEPARWAYHEFVIACGRPHFELPGQFGLGVIYV